MDIETLTLVAGRVTAARRGPAVPQLDCRGSLCTSEFMPTTVQCVNRGSDGSSVQWKCDADLDNRVKFGHIVVTCEGFSFTGDSTVLIGSCGLEYELLGTNVAARGGHETHQAVGPILGLLVIAIVLLVCVCICICLSFDRGGARAPVIVGGSPVILAASPPWYYSSWGGSGSSYSSSSSGRSGGGGGGSRSASGFGGSRSR